jgi:PTS system nitrogen regulatory IIA component
MDIKKIISSDKVISLSGNTKKEIFDELLTVVDAYSAVDIQEVKSALWQRERMIATGIGNGLGLPHVRLSTFANPLVIVGVCENSIEDYNSVDDIPIDIVVFIAASDEDKTKYLDLLKTISGTFKETALHEAIRDCAGDTEAIYNAIIKSV